MGDNLECITLIDKELLTLGAVVHFLGIFRYKGVKEGIETFVVASLGTQDPTCRDGQSGTETCENLDSDLPSRWASCRRDPKCEEI